MKILKPIRDYDSYSDPIARAIFDMLDKEIFHPLYRIMQIPITRQNALGTPLTEAIRTGDIQYVDGYFYGPLRISISKELRGYGAVYNLTRKAYKLEISRLPQNILQAIAESKQQNADQVKKVEEFLDAQSQKTMMTPEIGTMMDTIIDKLKKQFESTTKSIDPSVIEIPFDQKFAEEIKDAYTKNLDKYIQLWHDEQILRLREKVSQNVQGGYRAEKLIDTIMGERKVSFNKALFLAKQETSLMTAKYREVRYADVGVNEYMWSTSHDSRVRHDHAELNGKIFRFDHPPVTNRHTMARNNPGEDYGCRCVAIPVLSTVNMLEREYATN